MINISSIKNISRVKKCAPGTVITGDGAANAIFVIVKGEAGVYTNYLQPDTEMIQTLGSGDVFADPGLLKDQAAVYTVVSLGDVIMIPIEKKSITEFFQDEPALAFELFKEICLRLEQMNIAYKELIVSHHDGQRRQRQPLEPSPGAPRADAHAASPEKETPAGPGEDKPAQPQQKSGQSASALFPEGHGSYVLPLQGQNTAFLMNKPHTCPICRASFTTLAIRPSKLIVSSTDSDLRYHYKEIEPLYYEVLTCPNCLYSALSDQFDSPEKSKLDIMKALEPLKGAVTVRFGAELTTESVFAGFYLALFCAPIAFTKYQLTAAKLQYKLSRVYCDAGDAAMENHTALSALDNYLYAYARIGIPPSQEQQICVLIGELYLKQNDLKNALGFFNRARSCTGGSPVLKNHAENRSYDIREMAAKKE